MSGGWLTHEQTISSSDRWLQLVTRQGARGSDGKWSGPGLVTPTCHCVAQRVKMLGAQSAQPIGARDQLTASEAGYMTAPDRNVQSAANSLRGRGRSIHVT